MRYPLPRERFLSGFSGFEAGPRRARKQLCASSAGAFHWLRLDPCVERTVPSDADAVPTITSADVASQFLHDSVGFARRGKEHLMVLCLDARNKALGVALSHVGGRSSAVVDPVIVFQPGVLIGASGIIVAHNHPSGDPHPSAEDLAVTKQLAAGARLLALPLLDHMILTDDPKVFYSFQQQGTM